MKYITMLNHLDSLQHVVDIVGGDLNVRADYNERINNYILNKQPDLYCLGGRKHEIAKLIMREYCFSETSSLVNIILNNAIEKK